MPGRIDEAVYVAAQMNAAQAVPQAPEFRRHLERILSSPAFRGSHRSQEFLRHVVELSLQGEFDRLKERMLGIEIFHREAQYDTSQDAIVRVTANEVRKRLIQYYAETPAEGFRIRLPAGSYIPEFNHLSLKHPPEGESKAPEGPLTGPHEIHSPQATTGNSERTLAQGSAVLNSPVIPFRSVWARPIRFFGSPWRVSVCFAILFLVGAWVWKGMSLQNRSITPGNIVRDAHYRFYSDLLGPLISDPQIPTEIIVSNPKLFLYRGSGEPNPNEDIGTLKIPLTPSLAKQLTEGANDTQAYFPFHRLVLDTDDYTGMGEAKALFGLGRVLEALDRPARLSEARFLNWDAARSAQLIVLGAPHMSAWTQNSLAKANFTIAHDSILNSHPLAGEQSVYVRTGGGMSLDDYGLIWMSQLPSGSRILVLAGITSTGTAGVGSFFSDPDSMEPVYKQLKQAAGGTMPANWQILLHINARDNVPIKETPIALRINPPSS